MRQIQLGLSREGETDRIFLAPHATHEQCMNSDGKNNHNSQHVPVFQSLKTMLHICKGRKQVYYIMYRVTQRVIHHVVPTTFVLIRKNKGNNVMGHPVDPC